MGKRGDVIKMVNVNAITPRRELKLRREILVWNELNTCKYINGVSFREQGLTNIVFTILSHWDFQSKLYDDESILYDLIRDSKMTYQLQYACQLVGLVGLRSIHVQALVRTLMSLSDNVKLDNDVDVIDGMIEKLCVEKIVKDNLGFDADARIRLERALKPICNYLEDLKNNMLGDEMHVRDIVERELQEHVDNGSFDVKLKLGIKKNV